jgi:hypothetical protein
LIRRFLIVSAYCEEPVAYCRVAALESAERMGFRRACIVAVGCHEGRAGCTEEYRGLRRGGAGFERAGSCDTFAGILRLQLGLSQIHRQGPVRARQPHENTSSINPNSAHQKAYVRTTRTMVCRKVHALRDDECAICGPSVFSFDDTCTSASPEDQSFTYQILIDWRYPCCANIIRLLTHIAALVCWNIM